MSGWIGQPQCLNCGEYFDPYLPFKNFCSVKCEKEFIKYLDDECKEEFPEYFEDEQKKSKLDETQEE